MSEAMALRAREEKRAEGIAMARALNWSIIY